MFPSKSLYYLNLMGIQPWVRRERRIEHKWLVLVSSPLHGKSLNFLHNILHVMGIEIKQCVVKDVSEQALQLLEDLRWKPVSVLCFSTSKPMSEKLPTDFPVFSFSDLGDFIKNPKQKKELFQKIASSLSTINPYYRAHAS